MCSLPWQIDQPVWTLTLALSEISLAERVWDVSSGHETVLRLVALSMEQKKPSMPSMPCRGRKFRGSQPCDTVPARVSATCNQPGEAPEASGREP